MCNTLGAATGSATFTTDATCDTTAMLGGCQATFGDGSKQTNWYYMGTNFKTTDDVKAACDSDQTFVAPQSRGSHSSQDLLDRLALGNGNRFNLRRRAPRM